LAGYTLDEVVGRGGAGVVYRAYADATGRAVAVKILTRPLGDDAATKRAWRELHLLSELRLPCLPQVLDFGQTQGRLYIVTDFIDGMPLDDYCELHELAVGERVELLARVADAVQVLHEHRLVHRDLKPANVLIDGHGAVVIVDLGLAALFGDDATQTVTEEGVPVGSPAFMSPEQARGERGGLTTRSDIYSLGATAYAIVTGQTPHDTQTTILEAVRRVGHDPPRPPRELAAELPGSLAAVLHKCVSPKPADRYSSAEAFAEDLRRYLRGDAVEARPPGTAQRLGRFVGRHPIAATATACATILLLTVILSYISVWWLNGRPWEVVVTDGGSVRLLSRIGDVLHEWNGTRAADVIIAEQIEAHPLITGRALLLGLNNCEDHPDLDGRLALISFANADEPVWTTRLQDRMLNLPGMEERAQGDAMYVQCAMLADVFPTQKGVEILAVHLSRTGYWSLIRVYTIRGDILFEAWHEGYVLDVHWLAEPRLIVAAGVNNFIPWTDPNIDSPQAQAHVQVVFALDPDDTYRGRWASYYSDDTHRGAVWYRRLAPVDVSRDMVFARDAIEPVTSDSDHASQCRLVLLLRGTGAWSAALTINAAGEIISCVPADTYKSVRRSALHKGRGEEFPDFHELRLRELKEND
jgi:hypothetical protein